MAYWFRIGDTVEVVEDVPKAGISLRGRIGTVVETWEKCDVDPTCCCAEQVDVGMAVRVKFEGKDPSTIKDSLFVTEHFTHYFAEEELLKITVPDSTILSGDQEKKGPVPFDGLSCTAFKLDKLATGKPRKLSSFEPTRLVDKDT